MAVQMTRTELARLAELVEIAAEDPCPLNEWEKGFIATLERTHTLSENQEIVFDRLVAKHL